MSGPTADGGPGVTPSGAPAPFAMQRLVCALAVALEDRDEIFAALFDRRSHWTWDGASGVLSGSLPCGARWAARLSDPAPPFPGRALMLEIVGEAGLARLVRTLAPHELLPE
jgi:hypothetical protein